MDIQNKTPIDILQELITIHTSRIDVAEKLTKKQVAESLIKKLSAAKQQSHQFTSELMNELSGFGDAVHDGSALESEYEMIWKNTVGNIDAINAGDDVPVFAELEDSLKKIYQNILQEKTGLPDSIRELLAIQSGKL